MRDGSVGEGRKRMGCSRANGWDVCHLLCCVTLLYCIDCIALIVYCIVVFWGNRLEKCSYPIGVSRVHTRKTPRGTFFVSRWCEPASFAAGECWREGLEHRPTAIGDTRNNRMRENDVNKQDYDELCFIQSIPCRRRRSKNHLTRHHHASHDDATNERNEPNDVVDDATTSERWIRAYVVGDGWCGTG